MSLVIYQKKRKFAKTPEPKGEVAGKARSRFVVQEHHASHLHWDFRPYVGSINKTELGSMTSMVTGKALGYALNNLQERGTLYIKPGTEVYEGMVIGNTAKGVDMPVNPIKGKQLTNTRASGTDEAIKCTPPMELTLEKAIGPMRDDEFLEVTPTDIRLRKQFLTENDRKKHSREK